MEIFNILRWTRFGRRDQFEAAVTKAEQALEQGSIRNSIYKEEVRYWVARVFEDICIVKEQWGDREVMVAPDIQTVLRFAKKGEAYWKAKTTDHATFAEMIEVAQMLDQLKPMIVKGREVKSVAEPAWSRPGVARDVTQRVMATIRAAVDPLIEQWRVEEHAYVCTEAAKFIEAHGESVLVQPNFFLIQHIAAAVLKREHVASQKIERPARLGPRFTKNGWVRFDIAALYRFEIGDYAPAVQRVVASRAEDMKKFYLARLTKKLGAVFTAKPDLAGFTIDRAEVRQGAIQTHARVEFQDRSAFSVATSVRWNHSSAGKPFLQFPTTFHDVVTAAGERIKNPSEQKMVEVFGVVIVVEEADVVGPEI